MLSKFCPRCNGKLINLKSKIPHCAECAYKFHRPCYVSALGLVVKKGKILLIKRQQGIPGAGQWDLPGGFLEYGEMPDGGLKREIKEELNIKVKDYKLVEAGVGPYCYHGVRSKTVKLLYLITNYSGSIEAGDDASSVHWFDASKLPKSNWYFPWLYKACKKWLKK